jgi:NAD-dependent deacetylase
MRRATDTVAGIALAAAWLRAARSVLAFTGAGISTESGLPDFRSPTGIWSRYDPDEFSYQRFVSRPESRRAYWRWGCEFYPLLRAAEPNAGHRALAELERKGRLHGLVTQNIDGLHQRAGSQDVIELHGNALIVACLGCGKEWPRAEVHRWLTELGVDDPRCDDCEGILKPKTISFGQAMPEDATRRAFALAAECDLLLAIGTSLAVFPAAALVPVAKESGARVVIVNRGPTELDHLVDLKLDGAAGEILPLIAAHGG